jgi:MFS family permease
MKSKINIPIRENKEFFFLWICVLLSQIGDWMQITSQGWLVLDFSKSPLTLAIVTASGIVPQLIFVLYGGLIADQYNKKQVMRILVLLQFFISVLLSIVVITNHINAVILSVFSFALGSCAALWQPLYISFIPDLVPENRISNAMGISFVGLYSARTIGPALAGLAITAFGTRNTFIFNAISFLFPILSLTFIKTNSQISVQKNKMISYLSEGSRFVFHDSVLRPLWILSLGMALLISPSFAFIPIYAEEILHSGVTALSLLLSASGFGQLIGSIIVSLTGGLDSNRYGQHQILGYIGIGLLLICFSISTHLLLSIFLIFFFSLLYGVISPRINTIVQSYVQPNLRGRIQSLFLFIFGLVPVGQIIIGWFAETISTQLAITLAGVGFTLLGSSILLFSKHLITIKMEDGKLVFY